MVYMLKKTNRLWIVLIAILLLVILFFFFPLTLSYNLKTAGKISNRYEWLVTKDQNNQLNAAYIDHLTGAILQNRVFQFERNDIVNYRLTPDHFIKKAVSTGDTVALVNSNELEKKLEQLYGELNLAEANLVLYRTGEKASVIEGARKRVDYERGRAEEQRRIVARLSALRDQNLISEEEYESARSRMDLYDIKVELAEAQLQTVSTGAQPELIRLEEVRAKSLRKQIHQLKKRVAALNLISPLDGELVFFHNIDTLFSVRGTDQYCLLIPVRYSDRKYISIGQTIKITLLDEKEQLTGQIATISSESRMFNKRQVLFVTAAINAHLNNLVTGIIVPVRIQCEPVSLSEKIRRMLMLVTFN